MNSDESSARERERARERMSRGKTERWRKRKGAEREVRHFFKREGKARGGRKKEE